MSVRSLLHGVLFIVIAILAGSCGDGPEEEPQTVFRYNQASGITSLDPAFAKDQANIWATNQLFDGLVKLDDSLNVVPAIAKRWTISKDGLEYTFYLREDVYFHPHQQFSNEQARNVTAQDFVYSFQRLLDPEVASPGGWVFRGRVDSTRPFVAVNDTTLAIHLSQPFPPFLGLLTMQYCSVVPKEIVDHYGPDFRTHPVGTGPFQFRLWKEDESLILKRYDNYYQTKNGQQLPYLDAVKVTFQQDKQVEFLRFKQGKLDFISGIEGDYRNEILTQNGKLRSKYKGKFRMVTSPYLNTEYLGFLMKGGEGEAAKALRKKAVRQAINYGFDRQKMINYLRNSIGIPAHHGFVPPVLYNGQESLVKGYRYNPGKASRLLRKAGYPHGEGLPVLELHTNKSYVDFATFIQDQLQEIGIEVEINVTQPSALREWMSQGKVNFFRGSWIGDYADAESYLGVFYGPNPAPPNYTRFHNERYDSLYEVALEEEQLQQRLMYYRQMEEVMIEQAPVVPLYYDEVVRFVHNDIKGLKVNPMNLLDLSTVQKKERK